MWFGCMLELKWLLDYRFFSVTLVEHFLTHSCIPVMLVDGRLCAPHWRYLESLHLRKLWSIIDMGIHGQFNAVYNM